MRHLRTTRVRCDRCGDNHHITTLSDTQLSEFQWDLLLVEKLHRLGWSAGVEPSAHHQRIPPDTCPTCKNTPTKARSDAQQTV